MRAGVTSVYKCTSRPSNSHPNHAAMAEGEEVITSEYENFAHRDKVVLRPGGK